MDVMFRGRWVSNWGWVLFVMFLFVVRVKWGVVFFEPAGGEVVGFIVVVKACVIGSRGWSAMSGGGDRAVSVL